MLLSILFSPLGVLFSFPLQVRLILLRIFLEPLMIILKSRDHGDGSDNSVLLTFLVLFLALQDVLVVSVAKGVALFLRRFPLPVWNEDVGRNGVAAVALVPAGGHSAPDQRVAVLGIVS